MGWLAETLRWLLILSGSLLTAGTLLSTSTQPHWWVRNWDFPRVHIGLAVAGVGLCYILFFSNGATPEVVFVAVCFAIAAWQAWRIYPYTRLAPCPVEDADGDGVKITLITSNVLMENKDHARWLERINEANADLVLALEVDQTWRRAIAALERSHPHTVHQTQDNHYGMALYSRLPLIDPEVRYLVQDDIPSIRTGVELPAGRRIRIYCVHPRPPEPLRHQDSEPRDAELVVAGREINNCSEPTIILGDFNDVAWSRTTRLFQKVSGLLDPRRGRGLFNTFHAEYFWARFPLDHVFHSAHFKLIELRCLGYVGSDHFPVYVALHLEPEAMAEQEEPHADAEDRQEAQEKIERAAGNNEERQDAGGPVQQQAREDPAAETERI